MNKEIKTLDANKVDAFVGLSKTISGIIPGAGSFLSEIISYTIPNQRLDRLVDFVKDIEARLSKIESSLNPDILRTPEAIDILEESFLQVSRSYTQERRDYIASLFENSLTSDEIELGESKYLLGLLSELNEEEIIWLRFYLHYGMDPDKEFMKTHKATLTPAASYINASDKIKNRAAVQDNYKDHLERVGLISAGYKIDRNTGQLKYDQSTGKPQKELARITRLGKLLLLQIGMYSENDHV